MENDMKMKTWAPAVLAIVLGGGAAMLFRNMMLKPHPPAAVAAKSMQVVIANNDLIVGQELRAENLSTTTIQTPSTPIDYCTHPAELVGRVLTSPVLKGQNILQSNLAPAGSKGNLPSLIPAGMRAMTINVDEGNSQAGMLLPGCRVDVVGTFPNGRQSVTRTLVPNVMVQAVGQRLTSARSEDGKEPPPYHTVTLIVTPREGEIIDLATTSGRMRLLLRGLVHSDNEFDPGNVLVSEIDGYQDNATVSVGNPTTHPSSSEVSGIDKVERRTVELIKGSTTTKIEFDVSRPQTDATIAPDAQQPAIPGSDKEAE
jgi:pilus assembly protein CpaB